jgi:hypothetical protein
MKPSAIKTRCIYADIHGLAQRSPVSTQLSIHRRRVRELQTCAVTVERSFQTLQIGTLVQNHVHKFGECNQAKKFFRADHFRQHLKHSHAGTSGKWTNMLENACMRDEPLPERVGSISSMSGHMSGLAPKPGVIDEVHDES